MAVDEFLAYTRNVEREWVTPYLYRYEDGEAIQHLFRVASSLDSMVVGEPQILGQLKAAYALAKQHGTVNGFLDNLLTRAFNVAKRVRSETGIGPRRFRSASPRWNRREEILGRSKARKS